MQVGTGARGVSISRSEVIHGGGGGVGGSTRVNVDHLCLN